MKRFKKMMAIAIVAVMTMMYAVPTAFAADDYKLTINNTQVDHTYTAYQIFKGTKADKTQVSYTAATGFVEGTTYYVKNGADYAVIEIADATAYGAATANQTLYVRSGDSALGDPVWGANITAAGKVALYTEYGIKDEGNVDFTTTSTNLDKAANIIALLNAIADEGNTTSSESDKAVRFANVFFETVTEDENYPDSTNPGSGNKVKVKDGLLTTPATGQVKKATGTSVEFTDLASGYYLVNDSYEPKTGEVNGVDYSIARIAVQVVGDTTINNKADKTTTKKEIKTADNLYNEKANELGIGRAVEYEVTETVPNYDGYKHYYFNMNDTMTSGLTFNNDIVLKVKIGVGETGADDEGYKTLRAGTDYFVYLNSAIAGTGKLYPDATALPTDDTHTFIIAFNNIMDYPVGAEIVATYSATVNSSAVTGINPNTNEITTLFSNDPTKSDKGDKQDYPGIPANTTTHPVGTTPTSYTDTYTTKLTIHKQDGDSNALEGVEFTLTGTSQDVVLKSETTYELDSTGTYYMLKNGKYTTTAPQTVATKEETTGNSGWVIIDANDEYTGNDIRVVGTDRLRPFVLATDQSKTRYIINEPNVEDYASTTLKYKQVTNETADKKASYAVSRVGKTDSSGNLEFSQLGAGTYTLSETQVLPGYNDLEDITFTITCEVPDAEAVLAGTEQAEWTVSSITPTGTTISQVKNASNEDQGIFEITLVNNKGAQLPSTGGIGTTLFYLIGGLLVIGAGVVLVTRRRVNSEE